MVVLAILLLPVVAAGTILSTRVSPILKVTPPPPPRRHRRRPCWNEFPMSQPCNAVRHSIYNKWIILSTTRNNSCRKWPGTPLSKNVNGRGIKRRHPHLHPLPTTPNHRVTTITTTKRTVQRHESHLRIILKHRPPRRPRQMSRRPFPIRTINSSTMI